MVNTLAQSDFFAITSFRAVNPHARRLEDAMAAKPSPNSNVLTSHWSDLNRTLVENPDLAVLWLRALQSFDEFGAHLGRFLRMADSLYLSVLDGTLDKRLWRGYERTLADSVAYPGFQTWWATRKHWHTDEFCALIDRYIQTATPKIYEGYN
jgi:hypothetical protein